MGQYNSKIAKEKRIRRICPICNKEYWVKPSESHKFMVCSKKCRGVSQRRRIIENCFICNKKVERTPSQIKKSSSGYVFCNIECVGTYNSTQNKQLKKTCLICKKDYYTIPSLYDKSKTCSVNCQHKWQSKFLIRENANNYKGGKYLNCLVCGTEFYAYKYQVENNLTKFCSVACKQENWKKDVITKDVFKKKRYEGILKHRQMFPKETKPEEIVRVWLEEKGFVKDIDFAQEQGLFHKYIADFWFIGTRIVIEVYGDYWHGNPEKYGDKDGLTPLDKHQKYQRRYDIERLKDFEKHNFKVLVLWENDLKHSINQLMTNIIKSYKLSPRREREM
ncbi:hypothetical protein [Bacillus sp. V5-8f]|uniref:hypothetical protein n=1 Tax=Bacillus sp. V5-8f TaxID=2053044 RepID=UPI0011589E1E|nr:hypothetical protein [Bacillus sp. V5-8f]